MKIKYPLVMLRVSAHISELKQLVFVQDPEQKVAEDQIGILYPQIDEDEILYESHKNRLYSFVSQFAQNEKISLNFFPQPGGAAHVTKYGEFEMTYPIVNRDRILAMNISGLGGKIYQRNFEAIKKRYTKGNHLRCIFHCIIVKNQSLKDKYMGGFIRFHEKYKDAEFTKDLTLAVMSIEDGYYYCGIKHDLMRHSRMREGIDFVAIDFFSEEMKLRFKKIKQVGFDASQVNGFTNFGTGWLRGYRVEGAMQVFPADY